MKKVLIIDDDQTFQKAMGDKLRQSGCEALNASNGEEGLAVAHLENPDLILLDINMPVMGGMDFLRKLNQGSKTKIPIFITSNMSSTENIGEGVALGVRGYIIKSNESLDIIMKEIEPVLNPITKENIKENTKGNMKDINQ